MNISGVGTPASGALSSQYSTVYNAATSQRLQQLKHRQQLQGGYDYVLGSELGIPDKKRLIPSRKREERIAIENIQYRMELSQMLHSSSQEDFMLAVFGRKITLESVPPFLKKVVRKRQITDVLVDNSQDDVYDNEFTREALFWHAMYRRRHNSSPLKLKSQLCRKAQAWANRLAHTNTFMYEDDKSVGQNIFYRPYADSQSEISAHDVVSFWYSQNKNYVYNEKCEKLQANINVGNFTQLVWKSSKFFGIGLARSRTGRILVVADYQPPGNMSGMFKQNVLPVSLMALTNDNFKQ